MITLEVFLLAVIILKQHLLGRDLTRRKSLRPGRLTAKDRRLLKMIAVIFIRFNRICLFQS